MNPTLTQTELKKSLNAKTDQFYVDVLAGLNSTPRRLFSKYFYDAKGDKLFQDLMNNPEYYPTNCELEIFSGKTADIAAHMIGKGDAFDLIELGAGDAMKSTYLLKHLLSTRADFTYLPIDISGNVISYLNATLPVTLPGLQITGLHGEYFEMLKKAASLSSRRKVVLFLGSNIGNLSANDGIEFCRELRRQLSGGDMLFMGMDLKKNPKTVLAAYNDQEGITKNFNLNLLERINRELNADFDLTKFDHYPTYDPETGACKSYLISLEDQKVTINHQDTFAFQKNEHIYMEISQKFTAEQADEMAKNTGFIPAAKFFDSRKWFMDVVWLAK